MNIQHHWIKLPPRNVMAAIGIILVTTVFDAFRDGYSGTLSVFTLIESFEWHMGYEWIRWHGIKWVAFYLPLGYIAATNLNKRAIIWTALSSWILWSLALELTPATWHGTFIKLIIKLMEVF